MESAGKPITNVGEHAQTKLEYLDAKLLYRNLKNEVANLEKKRGVVEKHNVPAAEREAIVGQLTRKQTELEHAKETYKQRRNERMKDMFHRSN